MLPGRGVVARQRVGIEVMDFEPLPVPAVEPARRFQGPSAVVFILDSSSSMEGWQKFGLASEFVIQAINHLAEDDRFAMVAFSRSPAVIAHFHYATKRARERGVRAVSEVALGRGSDLGGSLEAVFEQLVQGASHEPGARCVLVTDGHAHPELSAHKLRERPLAGSYPALTTVAVGAGANLDTLRHLAAIRGGRLHSLRDKAQIPWLVASEFG